MTLLELIGSNSNMIKELLSLGYNIRKNFNNTSELKTATIDNALCVSIEDLMR